MPTPKNDFIDYLIDHSANGCLDVVINCAKDGHDYWRSLFARGFANVIEENSRLRTRFFKHLCIDEVQPHSGPIFQSFLENLTEENRQQFFSTSALKDKNHPANHVFSRAAFTTPSGTLAFDLLKSFISTGLCDASLNELALRRHLDVKMACTTGNHDFLNLLFQHLRPAPSKLLVHVVENPKNGPVLVAKLIQNGTVPLQTFKNRELLIAADEHVLLVISGLEARQTRV